MLFQYHSPESEPMPYQTVLFPCSRTLAERTRLMVGWRGISHDEFLWQALDLYLHEEIGGLDEAFFAKWGISPTGYAMFKANNAAIRNVADSVAVYDNIVAVDAIETIPDSVLNRNNLDLTHALVPICLLPELRSVTERKGYSCIQVSMYEAWQQLYEVYKAGVDWRTMLGNHALRN